MILILYLYTKKIAKKKFLNYSFGLGDILFFYAIAIGFPTITFIVIYSFSIIFSLFTFLIFKKSSNFKTVPLAGLMSFFLFFIITYSMLITTPSLYFY